MASYGREKEVTVTHLVPSFPFFLFFLPLLVDGGKRVSQGLARITLRDLPACRPFSSFFPFFFATAPEIINES